jgi:4'-phosphopantetheinyl transferase
MDEALSRPLWPDELRVFYAFTKLLAEPEQARRCLALISVEESARHQRFRFQEDRDSYLLAHALARSILAGLCGADPLALRFEAGEHGRPELVSPRCEPRLRFNLSHTRGLVACAVALDHDVGVDVEHLDRRVQIDQLAPSVFSDAERAALARLSDDARRVRFFELWTLKEAYIKAVGKGLALRLQSITLELDAGPRPQIAFAPPLDDDPRAWWFDVRQPLDGYMLAAALRLPAPSRISVRAWPPQDEVTWR